MNSLKISDIGLLAKYFNVSNMFDLNSILFSFKFGTITGVDALIKASEDGD